MDEKGNARSFFTTTIVLILAAALAAAILFWYFRPAAPPPNPVATPVPSTGAFQGDPAEATDKLLKTLNGKFQSLDLLKLISKSVETRPATVQGKILSTYIEVFHLPLRYSPGQVSDLLNEAAQTVGAKLLSSTIAGDSSLHLHFGFNPDWVPVVVVLERLKGPQVCLIIDDGGYQRGDALEHLYAFKVPVTVAIIPDVEFSKSLAEEFPTRGVEVMCHMPMEGHEKGMVGGNYKEILKKGMGDPKVRAEVEQALEGLPNCRGLNNHMGSVATTDPELIWDVCQVLKSKGLFIIDSRTTAQSVVEPVAKKAGLPVAHRDVFLDNVETPDAILRQLDQLVARAKKKGLAVGIGHFKTVTLQTLELAIPKLKEQGIQFVYASEVVK